MTYLSRREEKKEREKKLTIINELEI